MNLSTDNAEINKPLLSLCIPTRNRCDILKNSLDSIVSQDIFINTNFVEIVISDNCSTDNTHDIVKYYVNKFPSKVKYFKLSQEVDGNYNFANALLCGSGKLLKLHNDTIIINSIFLYDCIQLIQKNQNDCLFFLNANTLCRDNECICEDVNSFIKHVSYYSTWIGGFCLWSSDLNYYIKLFNNIESHFVQTGILLTLLVKGNKISVQNKLYFIVQDAPKNIINVDFLNNVFVAEYVCLLNEYCANDLLVERVKIIEIIKYMIFFYFPYYKKISKHGACIAKEDAIVLEKYLGGFLVTLLRVLYPVFRATNYIFGHLKNTSFFAMLRENIYVNRKSI